MSAKKSIKSAVPVRHSRLQPLLAIYCERVRIVLEKQFAGRTPTDLYGNGATRIIAEQELRKLDPEGVSFVNLNTPQIFKPR